MSVVSLITSELVARFVVVLAYEAVVPESEVLKIEGPISAAPQRSSAFSIPRRRNSAYLTSKFRRYSTWAFRYCAQAAAFVSVASPVLPSAIGDGSATECGTVVAAAGREAAVEATGTDARSPPSGIPVLETPAVR